MRIAVERDPQAERGRLERELAEAQEMVKRSKELLAKPGFTEKAPAEVVAKERARLKEREERLNLLETELRKRRG